MSYSSQEVVNKLKEWGELIGFKAVNEFRVNFPKIRRDVAYIDCVWFTKNPVEVPVIGFEISVKSADFVNFKKMKADVMNLLLLNPRLGILAVNEKETAKSPIHQTWYEKVDTYKMALKAIASPVRLKILDISDITNERIPWRELLKEVGLKLIQ